MYDNNPTTTMNYNTYDNDLRQRRRRRRQQVSLLSSRCLWKPSTDYTDVVDVANIDVAVVDTAVAAVVTAVTVIPEGEAKETTTADDTNSSCRMDSKKNSNSNSTSTPPTSTIQLFSYEDIYNYYSYCIPYNTNESYESSNHTTSTVNCCHNKQQSHPK